MERRHTTQFAEAAAVFRRREMEMLRRRANQQAERHRAPRQQMIDPNLLPSDLKKDFETVNTSYTPTSEYASSNDYPSSFDADDDNDNYEDGHDDYDNRGDNNMFLTSADLLVAKDSNSPESPRSTLLTETGFEPLPSFLDYTLNYSHPAKEKRDSISDRSTKDPNSSSGYGYGYGNSAPKAYLAPKSRLHTTRTKTRPKRAYSMTTIGQISPLKETPDIHIEVKIPFSERLKQLRQRPSQVMPDVTVGDGKKFVPEHVRKVMERTIRQQHRAARTLQAFFWSWKARTVYTRELNAQRQIMAACKMQAYFHGWKARKAYSKLLVELRRRQETERRESATLKLQSFVRGLKHRRRYLFILKCKQKRELNEKSIKRIQSDIAGMAAKTQADIENMRVEYEKKRKDFKKSVRKRLEDNTRTIDQLKVSGNTMVAYLQNENLKLRGQAEMYRRGIKDARRKRDRQKIFTEEIATNTKSLTAFVEKKERQKKKNEQDMERCRHHYMPQYRRETTRRHRYCLAESRIKTMYQARIQKIVDELHKRCDNIELIEEVFDALEDCDDQLSLISPADLMNA